MDTENQRNIDTYKNFIYDLGFALKEYALEAKAEMESSKGTENELYYIGRLMACHDMISFVQNEAEAMFIPWSELRLDDIDPDRDLS